MSNQENQKEGKPESPKPEKKHYEIMIDKTPYQVDVECMTGRQMLTLAGKTPVERFQLNVRYRGGKVNKVGYDQSVCFSDPGIEKFMTLPLDQTEGVK